MRKTRFFIGLVVLAMLTGCGIRPSQLNPPEGKQARDLYPAVYPSAKTVDPNNVVVKAAPAPYAPVTPPDPVATPCPTCGTSGAAP